MLGIIEDFFGIYEVDAKKVMLYHDNKPKFDRLLDLALERYMRKRENAKPTKSRILSEYNWEVPEERLYDGDTFHSEPEANNHALLPFVEYNHVSSPEERFVDFLEKHSDDIPKAYHAKKEN